MIGTSWLRRQNLFDPLLVEMLRERGLDRVPWGQDHPVRDAQMRRWAELGKLRDGPVTCEPVPVADPAAMSAEIKALARSLGADAVGMVALRPEYIALGDELSHRSVIAIIVGEDYAKALDGAEAVDIEAMTTYTQCCEISTRIAIHIREELGYPARAHHNGGGEIQAIPVMYQAGFGELGKHGSLINPDLGAGFRPAFVTTDLPLAYDAPQTFGVQDYCMSCNLCRNNCPGDAIPAEYILTEGIKRWLTDIEKCYPISRLREAYCHICVDVCPYVHKANGDEALRRAYKTYMLRRKAEGYKTPKELDRP